MFWTYEPGAMLSKGVPPGAGFSPGTMAWPPQYLFSFATFLPLGTDLSWRALKSQRRKQPPVRVLGHPHTALTHTMHRSRV